MTNLQGWLATVANLEDTATALRKRMEQLGKIYEKYLDDRERFREDVEV